MFGISRMWGYGLAALALLAAVALGVRAIYSAGYDARAAIADRDAAIAREKAGTASAELKDELAALNAARDKERTSAKQEIDSLRVQLASGAVRLRIPVAPARVAGRPAPASGEARAQPDQAPAASAPGESRSVEPVVTAEIEPSTALELLSITADGDAAIRDLNECIDSYETLRKKLDALRSKHGSD